MSLDTRLVALLVAGALAGAPAGAEPLALGQFDPGGGSAGAG